MNPLPWLGGLHPIAKAVLSYCTLLLVLVAYVQVAGSTNESTPQTSPTTPVTVAPVEGEVVAAPGATLYSERCAACHGADLQGGTGPELGTGSEAAELSDRRYSSRITNGRNDMPAFSEILTVDQTDEIIAYLRAEQGA
jgi:mono/diheme cytochrome c family protein